MPTPMPTNSQFEQLQTTLTEIVKQGVIGFVILIGIAIVLVSAALLVVAWTRRNQKPVDTTSGTNAAINAFAEMINSQNEQIAEDRKLRREEGIANREQIQKLNERYIESISANADATNRIADNHDKLIALWNAEIGTKPYQGLVETANRIEMSIEQIIKQLLPANKDMQKKEIQDFQDALNTLREYVMTIAINMQSRVDEKRTTANLKTVSVNSDIEK